MYQVMLNWASYNAMSLQKLTFQNREVQAQCNRPVMAILADHWLVPSRMLF